jgi:hypothetical protein
MIGRPTTATWSAPEVLCGAAPAYAFSMDVYSLGLVMNVRGGGALSLQLECPLMDGCSNLGHFRRGLGIWAGG